MESNYAALQRDLACCQGELAARNDDIAVLKDAHSAAEAQVTQQSQDIQVTCWSRHLTAEQVLSLHTTIPHLPSLQNGVSQLNLRQISAHMYEHLRNTGKGRHSLS